MNHSLLRKVPCWKHLFIVSNKLILAFSCTKLIYSAIEPWFPSIIILSGIKGNFWNCCSVIVRNQPTRPDCTQGPWVDIKSQTFLYNLQLFIIFQFKVFFIRIFKVSLHSSSVSTFFVYHFYKSLLLARSYSTWAHPMFREERKL